jgi:hypothetical protein
VFFSRAEGVCRIVLGRGVTIRERWGRFLRLCEAFVKTCEKIFKESYHYKKRCEVITMPFWPWVFSYRVRKVISELDERIVALEVEVSILKLKLKRNGIE